MKTSQEDLILAHLQSGKSITPLEALNMFGCFRLGARIWDLRAKGYAIEEVDVCENGKRYGRYYLLPENEQAVIRNNHEIETKINEQGQSEFCLTNK